MDITDKIDHIIIEEGLKEITRNTLVVVLISIALLVGSGTPILTAVAKAHKEHKVENLTVSQLESLYKSIKTKTKT